MPLRDSIFRFPPSEWTVSEKRIVPVSIPIEALLASFFDLDLKKAEKERVALLNEVRAHKED